MDRSDYSSEHANLLLLHDNFLFYVSYCTKLLSKSSNLHLRASVRHLHIDFFSVTASGDGWTRLPIGYLICPLAPVHTSKKISLLRSTSTVIALSTAPLELHARLHRSNILPRPRLVGWLNRRRRSLRRCSAL